MSAPMLGTANDFVEEQLDARLSAVEQSFSAHGLAIVGPLISGVDDLIRKAIEDVRTGSNSSSNLVVILTTNGGYVEVVQRIAETFRRHYGRIDFVVPNYAYSAGTVLVMAGDAIHMDYYSRLGPIDPQVENRQGQMVPALGYLRQYERLLEKAQKNTLLTVEAQLLLDGFDQAELYKYEQARNLSITLLREWLATYKFKNWTKTETRKTAVTQEMREQRAAKIAEQLNDVETWHSHGRGISKDVLARDLNLVIEDYENDPERNDKIKAYYDLLEDYMVKRSADAAVHIRGRFQPYI